MHVDHPPFVSDPIDALVELLLRLDAVEADPAEADQQLLERGEAAVRPAARPAANSVEGRRDA